MHVAVDGLIYEGQATGGISRIYRNILPLMCDLDPELTVSLYLARASKQSLIPHPRIQVHRILPLDFRGLAFTGVNHYLRRDLALTLGVRASKDTIWHSTYYSQPLRWVGPKVVMVYDLIYFLYSQYFQSQHDEILRQRMAQAITTADVVMCISATTAQDVATRFAVASDKLKVVHLAASPVFQPLIHLAEEQDTKSILPTDKPFLLYVGSRSRYKNFAVLLDAYSHWSHRNQVDLVVVGSPWAESEMAEIQAKQLQGNVHMCSGIRDEQLNRLYNRAIAFVYPSLYEGFGIPLLEAMAVGCPIVASDIPSSREIARDYPVYFDPTAIDSLHAALDIVWLKKSEPTHTRYGQQIASAYSWEKTAHKTLQQYSHAATR